MINIINNINFYNDYAHLIPGPMPALNSPKCPFSHPKSMDSSSFLKCLVKLFHVSKKKFFHLMYEALKGGLQTVSDIMYILR